MHGRREPIECLIDSGAGPSVVSEALMDRLGITNLNLIWVAAQIRPPGHVVGC